MTGPRQRRPQPDGDTGRVEVRDASTGRSVVSVAFRFVLTIGLVRKQREAGGARAERVSMPGGLRRASLVFIPLMLGALARPVLAGPPHRKDEPAPRAFRHVDFPVLDEKQGTPAEVDSADRAATLNGGRAGAGAARARTPPSGASRTSADGLRDRPPLREILRAASFLADRGVTFDGWIQLDGSTVASGGQPNASGFDGQYLLDVAATVDAKKLLGWPGGTFLVDVQSHGGPSILTHQMPSIQDPDNMDAYPETSVDRAWYQQDLLRQKVQVQVGLLYVDDKFLTVPYGQNFLSLDFSSDSSISTFVLPTYPKGSFGGNAFIYPGKGLYFSFGVYNGHSTELPYDPGGNLFITEAAWQGSWHGLPFGLQVGVWRDTGRFRRFLGGEVQGAPGAYVVASQKLWQPASLSSRGLGVFFQFGEAPPSVAAIRRHVGAGLVWTGPAASRARDEIGLAFSDSILTSQDGFTHGFENEIEVYYRISVAHGLTIQPDLEYWQHPGGGSTPNTLLGLVRVMFTF
jgi:carbohydrate-selective porin OprB